MDSIVTAEKPGAASATKRTKIVHTAQVDAHALPGSDAIFNVIATAVLVFRADLTLARMNNAAEALLSLSASHSEGMHVGEIFGATSDLAVAIRRCQEEQQILTERDLVIDVAGQEHQALVDCSVTPWQGERGTPVAVVVELANVERHQHIQLGENLAAQSNITNALLRGLAHEIKNPLGGIRGAAQLLEKELDDQSLKEYTQVVIDEADRLRVLVDRMLGPRSISRPEMINIHSLLEHVRQLAAADAGDHISIVRDYDPSIPDTLADRDQLIQAILNIVRNAIEALGGQEGRVCLRTRIQRKFTIGGILHRLVIRVDIEDNGPGIDPELAESIFFPMVSGRPEGTGLGLPLSNALVLKQGGLIGFTSEPGRTVFTVWLPVRSDI